MLKKTAIAFAGLVLTASVAKADYLPIKNLGHGVVCSRTACMITFPRDVNVISIYRYHCNPKDVLYCRSAYYVDLGGSFLSMPTFAVRDDDPHDFFYKAVIASHYDKVHKRSIRRFVLEFKTKKYPVLAWDFNTSTLEVINSNPNFKGITVKPKKTVKHTASNVARPKVKPATIPKQAVSSRKTVQTEKTQPSNSHPSAPDNTTNTNTTTTTNTNTITNTITNTTTNTNTPKIISKKQNGKIEINFNAIKLSKKVLEAQPPKPVKVQRILTYEQMGDQEFKAGHYAQALEWYKMALQNAKTQQDRARIMDKVIAVMSQVKVKK